MATLNFEKNGRARILFVSRDGPRKTIRLGKIDKRSAETAKLHVEHLVSASISGNAIPDLTARWVSDLGEVLRDRLTRVGLIEPRRSTFIGQFLREYIVSRTDVMDSTRITYENVNRDLLGFLDPSRLLRSIRPGDADRFRVYLNQKGYSDNTIRRRMGIAKQFFNAAQRDGLIDKNPFDGQSVTVRENNKRYYFVTRGEADQVLDACPDDEWRLIFALSRFGGLRCPSEHMSLRWQDINWEHSRINVRSPKTEHHVGGDSRIVPIFPELLPYLQACFERADEGEEFVISRYRKTTQNLRTQLTRIIKSAGLNAWPKLFQNLRSTRQTELAEEFPDHVVCSWIGNSVAIARKHYLQVTEDHFARATKEEAAHNPAQHSAAMGCNTLHAESKTVHKGSGCNALQSIATDCDGENWAIQDLNL